MSKELYKIQLEDNILKEKIINIFISSIKGIVKDCVKSNKTDIKICNDVAFSILNFIDGNTAYLPTKINLLIDPSKFQNQKIHIELLALNGKNLGILNSLTQMFLAMKNGQNMISINDNIQLHKLFQSEIIDNKDDNSPLFLNKIKVCTMFVDAIKLIVKENSITSDNIFKKCNDIAFSILSLIDGYLIAFPTKVYLSINRSNSKDSSNNITFKDIIDSKTLDKLTVIEDSSSNIIFNDVIDLHKLYHLNILNRLTVINECVGIAETKFIKLLAKSRRNKQ